MRSSQIPPRSFSPRDKYVIKTPEYMESFPSYIIFCFTPGSNTVRWGALSLLYLDPHFTDGSEASGLRQHGAEGVGRAWMGSAPVLKAARGP